MLPSLPEVLPFFGYLYNVGTIAFGPWISYTHYLKADNNTYKVTLSFQQLLIILINCVTCLAILLHLQNCCCNTEVPCLCYHISLLDSLVDSKYWNVKVSLFSLLCIIDFLTSHSLN